METADAEMPLDIESSILEVVEHGTESVSCPRLELLHNLGRQLSPSENGRTGLETYRVARAISSR